MTRKTFRCKYYKRGSCNHGSSCTFIHGNDPVFKEYDRRCIQKDETIGFGRKGRVKQQMTIAIIPVGYADGLNRKLGNGKGKLLINGSFAPIVGDICMDTCMVDVTGISVKEGDDVIVFGEKYPVGEFAKALDTIPYEVLTSVSQRVKRVYIHE